MSINTLVGLGPARKGNNHMEKMIDESLKAPAETVVGPSVKIQGDLNSEGNIRIEGQVTGKIKTTQSVLVMEGAHIAADVLAGNAIIGGEVQGNLKVSGHLVLQGTAKVAGDISCTILRVEDGAQFTGKCSMGGAKPVPASNGKKDEETLEEE